MSRRASACSLAGLLLLCWWAWTRGRLDTEVLGLLPPDLASVQGLRLHQQHFQADGEVLILLEHEDADQLEAAAESLANHLRARPRLISAASWRPVWAESPDQWASWIAYGWYNGPPEPLQTLFDRLQSPRLEESLATALNRLRESASPEELARLGYDPLGLAPLTREQTEHRPRGLDAFSASAGQVRWIRVRARDASRDYNSAALWIRELRAEIEDWRQRTAEFGGIRTSMTGTPVFTAEISEVMRRDMAGSVAGTTFIIVLLFGLAHRRWKPLLRLVALLVLTMVLAGTAGAIWFQSLNVVSLGFAAILAGLVVDYGVVLQQDLERGSTSAEARRRVGPGILWGALTTAVAFFCLHLSGLPGLGQLGTLVGFGVLIGAGVMIGLFPEATPRCFQTNSSVNLATASKETVPVKDAGQTMREWRWQTISTILSVGALLGLLGVLVARGWPRFDPSTDALRPSEGEAYRTWDRLRQAAATNMAEPYLLIARGASDAEVRVALEKMSVALKQSGAEAPADTVFPIDFWPNPAHQAANRERVRMLVQQKEALADLIRAAGFTEKAILLQQSVFAAWSQALQEPRYHVPHDSVSQEIMSRFRSAPDHESVALAVAWPASKVHVGARPAWVGELLKIPGCHVTRWSMLAEDLAGLLREELWPVLTPVLICVLAALGLTFRSVLEWILSVMALALSVLALLGMMQVAGWSWNLMNFMAIPVLLGAGVDYSIHMLLALRRDEEQAVSGSGSPGAASEGPDQAHARSMTKAVWLCAATTMAGFGSLAWAENRGLASLGKLCSVGILGAASISTLLIPRVRVQLRRRFPLAKQKVRPPCYYSGWVWIQAARLAARLPRVLTSTVLRSFCRLDRTWNRQRFERVRHNLEPLCAGDLREAEHQARALYDQFAEKLADLLRLEGGRESIPAASWHGRERFEASLAQGRGVLLVTMHLGNWELGAAWLAAAGREVWVVTAPEPDPLLTAWREAARARRGVRTFVLGRGDFAFLELIEKLRQGHCVALLLDRTEVKGNSVVTCCGSSLAISPAPALLAQASGCVVLPVAVVREASGYAVHLLESPGIHGDALASPSGRHGFLQQLTHSFEPLLKRYASQWFQFVPVWERQTPSSLNSQGGSDNP
ncbi:MAG: hypothetical protein FJ404_09970 [Verrucomicrobia bacterium]|nr:hypothetical protein [Verrucomicrobiota bacterium]